MELNDLNVNNVLDEIRPFIEAVRMLGACAGCAMSAQTMTMGIEKLVKDKFPEVQRVISV